MPVYVPANRPDTLDFLGVNVSRPDHVGPDLWQVGQQPQDAVTTGAAAVAVQRGGILVPTPDDPVSKGPDFPLVDV